ncbi:Stress response protein SCP2 [Nakamurella panacisegetis]|uniref:Stress response protein SCP2 n=1 Tax=Nakamurella panacisegetis TaxID=1090615 RepID=A0A1H0MFG8_9ACTN|nr:TerD family protein [Nakamurella panacisegetis]SDO79178.1 Stress response protein SCP2 [Nakamurella panacisegetis]
MTVLSRGANAALPAGVVEVAVSGARQGSVDLMVFQLGPDHRVRTDADFVFFNQPASPEGAVRLVAADRVTADLNAVPAGVETLAVAVALDDSVPGSLASIPGLAVTVTGGSQAPASGLTTERAAVLVEIYRRAGGWKVRNVSAGWAAGLSALAGEHGVSVDEEPAPEALPSPVLPSVVSPSPAAGYPPQPTPPPAPAYPAPAPAPTPPPAYPTPPSAPAYPPPPSGERQPAAVAATINAQPPGSTYPMPGGFPPPGGSLPPPPPFSPPTPGGWTAPGGDLRR